MILLGALTSIALGAMITSHPVSTQYLEGVSEPKRMRVTCYTASEGAVTASESAVREGIVAASRKYMGYSVILYDEDMNFVGFFEVKDTGAGIDTDGDGEGDSIKKGLSIDVYRDTLDRCRAWIKEYGDYMYVQFVEGEG